MKLAAVPRSRSAAYCRRVAARVGALPATASAGCQCPMNERCVRSGGGRPAARPQRLKTNCGCGGRDAALCVGGAGAESRTQAAASRCLATPPTPPAPPLNPPPRPPFPPAVSSLPTAAALPKCPDGTTTCSQLLARPP
ncbi:WASP homolog-associated protein with actin, membranes and microtubules-like [Schistocerca serialis cubense]|uniref:WASP homolog-associated protein with actin, membranes and microtubules-like n=1 Tax=Schistocerca serialis cubense TaxID=2023355 RepID=UPI00214ED45C|nr:WASP homolog-associated protein with actin, membranes and microtubules-like [Schistocerca serialis cubense]